MKPIIAIIDLTGKIAFEQLERVASAVQKQIDLHAAPHWLGVDNKPLSANLVAFKNIENVPNEAWLITIENNIEPSNNNEVTQLNSVNKVYSATLYGYHLVNNKGVPYARLLYTQNFSKVLSHETLEMLVNPYLTRYIGIDLYSEQEGLEKVIQEIADPVQASSYEIDGIEVSNFILPAWYHVSKIEGEQYDFLWKLKSPKGILEGGYKSWLSRANEWWQVFNVDNIRIYQKISSNNSLTKSEIYRLLGFAGISIILIILLSSKIKPNGTK